MALLRTGEYHVIGAVRDMDKMEVVAEIDEFPKDRFTPMECELNSFESVKDFCDRVEEFRMGKPIDRLLCNAGVYQPSLPYAKWSKDNHEQTMQINYLSHFLMIRYVDISAKLSDRLISFEATIKLTLHFLHPFPQQTHACHDELERC